LPYIYNTETARSRELSCMPQNKLQAEPSNLNETHVCESRPGER
jgi:hypothetical protein